MLALMECPKYVGESVRQLCEYSSACKISIISWLGMEQAILKLEIKLYYFTAVIIFKHNTPVH